MSDLYLFLWEEYFATCQCPTSNQVETLHILRRRWKYESSCYLNFLSGIHLIKLKHDQFLIKIERNSIFQRVISTQSFKKSTLDRYLAISRVINILIAQITCEVLTGGWYRYLTVHVVGDNLTDFYADYDDLYWFECIRTNVINYKFLLTGSYSVYEKCNFIVNKWAKKLILVSSITIPSFYSTVHEQGCHLDQNELKCYWTNSQC